jgi:tRNA(Ile)-lysidine synthase
MIDMVSNGHRPASAVRGDPPTTWHRSVRTNHASGKMYAFDVCHEPQPLDRRLQQDTVMSEMQEHALERRVSETWPGCLWRDSHVVLAVSGGPDSVAMLRAVLSLKRSNGGIGQLLVAHFNHALRGPAANEDQAWLESLCTRLNVSVMTGRPDPTSDLTHARSFTIGEGPGEGALRAVRYRFLRKTAEQFGARFVAVAHTADDQVETVLHRLIRGTGLDGLAGMSFSRPLSSSIALVRPLLGVRRAAVQAYLHEIGQEFRTDESNADTRRTRNRLRYELLPLLRKRYNPGVDDALLRLATQACQSRQLIDDLAGDLARTTVTGSADSGVRIDCRRLIGTPPAIVRTVCRIAWQQAGWPLQEMGFEAWQTLAELALDRRTSPIVLPGNIRASRKQHHVLLEAHG